MALAKAVVHVATLKGDKGPVGKWPELEYLLSTTNLNTLKPGAYAPISTIAAEAMGLPTANVGTLLVYGWDNAGSQQWIPATSRGNEIWQRIRVGSAWGEWSRVDNASQLLLSTADIDNLPDGTYFPISTTAAAAMGLPSANTGPLVQHGRGASKQQTFTPISTTPRIYIRSKVSTTWSEWAVLTPGGGGGGGGSADSTGNTTQREMRLSTHRRRRGLVGTGDLPVVALVFDHGTNNFVNKILPVLRRLALPATLGLNSQMYNPSYQFHSSDNETSFSILQSLALNDGIEIWNHGRMHVAGSKNEILGGRDELMASMPRIPIEGWLHTGQYGDFNHGGTPEAYWKNDVGQTILNGHAIATGDLPGTIHPLDGAMVPGWDGIWMDSGVTIAQEQIQQAQASGGGVMTRLHPMNVDGAGYVTLAQLTDFLEWVAAERDAGRLTVLTASGMALADASVQDRDDVLPSRLLGSLNGWTGAGWSATSNGAVTTGGSALSYPLMVSRVDQIKGSQREFHALVRADAETSIRLTVAGTGLNATRSVTIPANTWVDVRNFFTVTLDATTLTFSITRISGGSLTVRSLNAYSA